MDFQELIEDMMIAQSAIIEAKLDQITASRQLICEVYCLTPFRWQTFYLRVYDGPQYMLQYAKPYIADHHGAQTVSASFRDARKANAHIGHKGDIYCGLIPLSKDSEIVNTLIRCLPNKDELHRNSQTTLDGISTVIINQTESGPATLCFRNEEPFFLNRYTAEEAQFLHSLFLHIEGLIGNIIRQNR